MATVAPAADGVLKFSNAYRWNILLLLSASQMISHIDRVNLPAVAPVLIRNYHYTPATVGLLLSAFSWAYTLALLPSGPFVDWVRARVGYIVADIIWSLATILCGITTAFGPLAAFRALVGVGQGPMIPSAQRILFETFPKEKRASAVGVFFAGNKIGLAIGIPFATLLLAKWGMASVFYVTGSVGFLWMIWFMATYRGQGRPAHAKSNIRWSTLLRYRNTWGIMLADIGYLYIYYVFINWLPGYLVLQRHMSVLKGSFVGMTSFLVGFVATLAGGWISDWMVKSGMRITVARKTMVCGGLILAIIFTLLGVYARETWTAVTMLTLALAGVSLATAAIQALPVDIAPPHMVSSLVSLFSFGGNLGASFAPALTGLLISISGGFELPLLVTAGIALVFGCGSLLFIVGSLDERLQDPPDSRTTA